MPDWSKIKEGYLVLIMVMLGTFCNRSDNSRMKKYDFTKYELWFSRSTLQLLACAERKRFDRHIRRVWRLSARLNEEFL